MIPKRLAQHRPQQATPADPAFVETRVDEHATAMDFTTRWPDLSESPNLEASRPSAISNSYTDMQTAADAEQQMPLIWPVAEAERVGQQQDPAGQAAFGSVFLVSALLAAGRSGELLAPSIRATRSPGMPRHRR